MKKLLITAVILPIAFFAGGLVIVFGSNVFFGDAEPETHRLPKYQAQVNLEIPKAVVDETTFDFGVMDPLTTGSHTFIIRNEGKAPLEIELGSTTCQCTLGKLEDSKIEPGKEGEVTLTWNTGRKHPVYSHGASLRTSDPRQAIIDLRVTGLVRVQLGFDPPEVVFSRVEPDSTPTTETVLFTQHWDEFTVENITSSLEGVTWELNPLGESDLQQRRANCGYLLSVTLPPGLPTGYFQHELTVEVKREGSEELETFALSLGGKVLRRLSAYGPNIDGDGMIDLGILKTTQAHRTKVLLKVRDEERQLEFHDIRVQPEFVHVEIKPVKGMEEKGLYEMQIEVPAGAPAGSYKGINEGSIQSTIEHPRISSLDLKLGFMIAQP